MPDNKSMKSCVIFGTRWSMYLTELPIIFLLCVSIYFNEGVETPGKLYPLIIACTIAIVFIFIYLLRAVIINTEKVRSFGPYSSKESCILNEGKALVLTTRPRSKIKIEVFGYDDAPGFDWVGNDRGEPVYSNLYRDIAAGGVGSIKRVLSYFGVPRHDIDTAVSSENALFEYDDYIFKKSTGDIGDSYSLEFKKTL